MSKQVSGLSITRAHEAANPCYDLLHSSKPGAELIMVNQHKAREFIRENPSFKIVGIGLSRDTVTTPFGQVVAVLE